MVTLQELQSLSRMHKSGIDVEERTKELIHNHADALYDILGGIHTLEGTREMFVQVLTEDGTDKQLPGWQRLLHSVKYYAKKQRDVNIRSRYRLEVLDLATSTIRGGVIDVDKLRKLCKITTFDYLAFNLGEHFYISRKPVNTVFKSLSHISVDIAIDVNTHGRPSMIFNYPRGCIRLYLRPWILDFDDSVILID